MVDPRLLELPLEDTPDIRTLRNDASEAGQVQLGLALAGAGCTCEAAALLRPLRGLWAKSPHEEAAKAALAEQTWYNKTWRDVAHAMRAGRHGDALALVGDRAARQWDQPALLLHLASVAREGGDLAMARHLLSRVAYLADRGIPRMDMAAFAYVARAGLIDVLADAGEVDAALDEHRRTEPNHGNAMAHEIQGIRLLALAGRAEEAMEAAARCLVTAREARKGFSREMREDFVTGSPELAALRERGDWPAMFDDPKGWLAAR